MRMIDWFDRGAEQYPDRDCLSDGVQGWSYATVRDLTQRIAAGLRAEGITPGSRIAVWSPNHAMAYACMLAISRPNGLWVPINARNGVEENTYVLNNNQTDVLFVHSGFAEHVAQIRAEVPSIRLVVTTDAPVDGLPFLDDWAPVDPEPAPDPLLPADTICAHVSSGGTTGRPKGVMLSSRAWETMVSTMHVMMPVTVPPVHLMVAPMTHAAGVVSFPLLTHGATNMFTTDTSPENIMQLIERHKVTFVIGVPTAFSALMQRPVNADISTLKLAFCGSAPVPLELYRWFEEVACVTICDAYGQPEATWLVSI